MMLALCTCLLLQSFATARPSSDDAARRAMLAAANDDAQAPTTRMKLWRQAAAQRQNTVEGKRRAARDWIEVAIIAGATRTPQARRQALRTARRLAGSGSDSVLATRIHDVEVGDAALVTFVRHKNDAAARRELQRAQGAWLSLGDDDAHARARLALIAADDKPADARARELLGVLDALTQQRLQAATRRDIYEARSQLLREVNDVRESLADALRADLAWHKRLPDNAQSPFWLSSPTFDRCVAEHRRDTGFSCAALALERLKRVGLFDASQRRQRALTPSSLEDGLSQHAPLLRQCLVEAAKNSSTLDDTDVSVTWTVHNKGHSTLVELRPYRLANTPLAECITNAVALFRYPRFSGEPQTVTLPFHFGQTTTSLR